MFHEKTFKEIFINNDEYYVLDEMQEPFIIAVSTPLMTKIENSFVGNEITENLIVPLYDDSEIFDASHKSEILSIKKKKENENDEFESKKNDKKYESKKMVDKCVNTDLTIEMMNKLINKKKKYIEKHISIFLA